LDSIEFFQKCHWKNTANCNDLYLKRGLSAAQIGEQLGISKQTVLNQLKRDGIRLGTNKGRLANPKNYRQQGVNYACSNQGSHHRNRRHHCSGLFNRPAGVALETDHGSSS
jgi:IS30 family transposase